MTTYLKIENPGVCPTEGFTLLGASTKSGTGNSIGKFGSGNKHGVNVCLRHDLAPVVFCDNLKLEFGTRSQEVSRQSFNRVFVKYGGKDEHGKNRSSTEDLGYVLEYGSSDWLGIDLALREFVSNAIDSALETAEFQLNLKWCEDRNLSSYDRKHPTTEIMADFNAMILEHRKVARDWEKVVIEIVNENQVRAKSGNTRVFIPMNDEVEEFYRNVGKWFLHFSEPEAIGKTLLRKRNRNLGDRKSAVIFRRGVRVREFESSDVKSLFDYNLENLVLDESRRVDDYRVGGFAAEALVKAEPQYINELLQSFVDNEKYWEHSFSDWVLERAAEDTKAASIWSKAFVNIAGDNAVITTAGNNQAVERKGYKRVVVPAGYNTAMRKMGIKTPDKVLTADDLEGRTIVPPTYDAMFATDFVWNILEKADLVNNKKKPLVWGFTHLMDAGAVMGGFYRNGEIFINVDLGNNACVTNGVAGLNNKLMKVVLEELAHYITGARDETRDFQDYAFLVAARLMLGKGE